MPQRASSFVEIRNGWPVVDVGALRHAITIQQQQSGSDASGSVAIWANFISALAAIETIRGTDVIKGGQTGTQLYLTVTMWYQDGVLPNMRVVSDNGSVYVIQAVENILEMNVVLVLNCLALGPNV